MSEINGYPLDFIIKCAEASEGGFNVGEFPPQLEKIITRGGPTENMPLFFLAKEKGSEDLYIAVRGATETCDFVRVLNFKHSPFLTGEVHGGVLEAARYVISESRKYIDACKGRIICTGHSLGGSTSAIIAAILRLEEKRENVICISEAPFPVFTEDIKKLTETFATSIIYNNDVVPLLSHKNIYTFLHQMVPPEAQQNPQIAAAAVGQIVQQLIIGILKSRGVTDPDVINSIREKIPVIVSNLMQSPSDQKELYLPGKMFQVIMKGQNLYEIAPFVEGNPLPNILSLMIGVQDHSLQLLLRGLETIAHPPPPPKPASGPNEVDDLD